MILNETIRIAKENTKDIRLWEERYEKTIASHNDEIEKLDSRLAGKDFFTCDQVLPSFRSYFCLTSLTFFQSK